MLYDPKWEAETKPDPWSLDGFIAWLETKPHNETYNYVIADECAIAQWRKYIGLKQYNLHSGEIPEPFASIVNHGKSHVHTFGEALKRARAAQSR